MTKFSGRASTISGVTLLELLVAIAIIAILLVVAVPSFNETIRSNQVSSQTNELVSLIHLGRNEAVRRNPQGTLPDGRTVRVQLEPDGFSWEGYVRPPTDDDTADGCPLGAVRCSDNSAVALTIIQGTSPVRFDNRGYSVNAAGAPTQVRLQLIHERAATDRHRRCITVFPGGQVETRDGAC